MELVRDKVQEVSYKAFCFINSNPILKACCFRKGNIKNPNGKFFVKIALLKDFKLELGNYWNKGNVKKILK